MLRLYNFWKHKKTKKVSDFLRGYSNVKLGKKGEGLSINVKVHVIKLIKVIKVEFRGEISEIQNHQQNLLFSSPNKGETFLSVDIDKFIKTILFWLKLRKWIFFTYIFISEALI